MKDMETSLTRVEIELVELAAAMTSVLAVLSVVPLFGGLFNGTVGDTPPWRPVVVSSARQENEDAWPPRTNAPFCSSSLLPCSLF
jgi:hypothetical protein